MNSLKRLVNLTLFLCLATFCAGQAVPVTLMPVPQFQALDANGRPLAFGCAFTYTSGTTNQLTTYSDYTGAIQNPNPVPLSASGSANIWIQAGQLYTVVVKSNGGTDCSLGTTMYSVDGIGGGTAQTTTVIPSGPTPSFPVIAELQLFTITLTQNTVSLPVSFVNVLAPAIVTFQIIEDGSGGWTFAWPSNTVGGAKVDGTANHTTVQSFVYDGTSVVAMGPATYSDGSSDFGTATIFDALSTFNAGWSGLSPGVFTNTANTENSIFGTKINGCNPSTEWAGTQGGTADTAGLFGCVKASNTSVVHQISGVAGYANGASPLTNVVGGFFSGRAQANSVNAWGSNSIVTDAGFNSTFLVGHEIDVNITGTPTTVWGLEMSGLQTVAPNTSGVSDGGRTGFILAGQNAPGWNTGFFCGQGVLKVTNQYANGGACLLLGAASNGNSQNSQGIVAYSTNSGGTHPYAYLLEDAVGTFEIANSPVQINHRLTFSTLGTCDSSAEGTMSPVTDSSTATWGLVITGGGAAHVLAYCDGTNWTVAAK